MKPFMLLMLHLFFIKAMAQPGIKPTNVFIITLDGLRWQEIFNGADERIINNRQFVKDRSLTNDMYGAASAEERRKKLMPFFWTTLASKGQLHGNRLFNNKVNVSNIYKISYPGYNEILTGYADPFLAKNKATPNKNITLLEYLNTQENYKGAVVAFSSWNVFPFILNEERSKIMVNSGYEPMGENSPGFDMINKVQDSVTNKTPTRYDLLTFLNAKEYLHLHHPKIMLLGLGETDEFGHQGKYDGYLQQANNADKMIAELWYFVQTDPFYKNNTIFIITTDHGRGSKPSKWDKHNILVAGSSDTWLAMIGPGIKPLGEIKTGTQLYQKQLAATIVSLINQKFEANHPVASAIVLPVSATAEKHQNRYFGFLNNTMLPAITTTNLLIITSLVFLIKFLKRKSPPILQQ